MKRIVLFIASSLDGFIAGPNGEIDWLYTDGDYGYKEFYDSIDITISGYKTYEQSLTFGEFPYPDKKNYVFTRKPDMKDTEYVTFVGGDIISFTKELKLQDGKDIWLIGGGEINTIMINNGLIDEIVLSVHPIVVGKGIPLFGEEAYQTKFKTPVCRLYDSGLVQMILRKT